MTVMKMKSIWIAMLLTVISFGMGSCTKDDLDDIRKELQEHNERLTALEEWQKSVNTDISSLQSLIRALESKNFITGVTPVIEGTEEVGYTITFQTGNPITIKHGKNGQNGDPGITPQIGASKDPENPSDETYYWTVKIGDGEPAFLTDGQGNKLPVTGPKGEQGEQGTPGASGSAGHTPVLSVEEDGGVLYWKVDGEWLLNGTEKVPATGEKGGPGDAIFQKDGIDNTHEDYVELTLADGTTKIRLPKYQAFSVSFESDDIFYASPAENELTLVLPATLKATDYRSIVATVTAVESADIQTRSTSNKWQVAVTEPSFGTDGALVANSAKVAVTGTEDSRLSETYLLRVALVATDGTEVTASRLVKYTAGTIATSLQDITDNNIKHLAWKGAMAEEDFAKIKTLPQLEVLDLTMAEATAVPYQGLKGCALRKAWLGSSCEILNQEAFCFSENLEEIDLPNVKTIEKWAFYGCTSLRSIDLTNVQTLGEEVFRTSTDLTKITLHEGLTTLSARTFISCGITTLEIPKTVTTIPERCFQDCKNLRQVYFHDGITSIGNNAFLYDRALERFVAPKSLTVIDNDVFHACYNLNYVELHDNITEIKANAFYYCQSLRNIVNVDRTTDINQDPFPKNLQTIGNGAFYGSGLEVVRLRETQVETIGSEVFYNCKELESLELPETLTTIDSYAFYGCPKISSIMCYATTPPTLSGSAFNSDVKKSANLICPNGNADDYRTVWSWTGNVRN